MSGQRPLASTPRASEVACSGTWTLVLIVASGSPHVCAGTDGGTKVSAAGHRRRAARARSWRRSTGRGPERVEP